MADRISDDQQPQPQPRPAAGRGILLLRYALPAAVILAGAIVMSLGSESELEGGAGIAGAGI
ncbi:MAG: hypothetical protein QOF54_849, partial [Solirubrobacteraceae bacterium]|nr:hypothetical protein [Solirubrobacteraceae bacterium]